MTRYSGSFEFRPWRIEELLDAEALSDLRAETAGDVGQDEDIGPVLDIRVVVDGWHIRSALLNRLGDAGPDEIVQWLNALGDWLWERFVTDQRGMAVTVVAWDAELSERQERSAGWRKLSPERQERFRRARRGRLQLAEEGTPDSVRLAFMVADWRFLELREVAGADFTQSGVDARIATELFRQWLDGADHLILVSADSDFVGALEVIGKQATAPTIEVIVVQAGKASAFTDVSDQRWQAWPAFAGPGFAEQVGRGSRAQP